MATVQAPYYLDDLQWETYKAAMGWPVDSTYDRNTGQVTLGTGPKAVPKSAMGSQALIPSENVNGTQFYTDPNFASYLSNKLGAIQSGTGQPASMNTTPGMNQAQWIDYRDRMGLPTDSTYDPATGRVTPGKMTTLMGPATAPSSAVPLMSATAAPTSASTTVDPFIAELRRQVGQGIQLTAEEYQLLADADAKAGAAYNPPGGQGALNGFVGYPQTSTANPDTGAATTNYSAGLTGSGGTGTTGNNVTPGMYDVNPELAYRQALGFGDKTALNPYERWQRDQFGDVQQAWQVQQEMNPTTTPTTFEDYLKQNGIGGARNFWKNASSSILGDNEMNNKLANMMSESDYNNALQNAVYSKYGKGSLYGSYLANQIPEASKFYNAQFATSPTTAPNSFLSYLKTKYGF